MQLLEVRRKQFALSQRRRCFFCGFFLAIFFCLSGTFLYLRLYRLSNDDMQTSSENYPSPQHLEPREIPAIPDENFICDDPLWCSIDMPKTSHFRFEPPSEKIRWERARYLASIGRQVLLEKIIPHFPNPLNFLDGDREFRRYHHMVDVFVDAKNDGLNILSASRAKNIETSRRKLSEGENAFDPSKRYVPNNPYDFRRAGRAPIVQNGYMIFEKNRNSYFSGNILGYTALNKREFLQKWDDIKNEIDVPFIAMNQGNENWGMLSNMFPNRTAKWGQCCKEPLLQAFLDHPKTLMLIINQHHNFTHPKLLTLPRGMPLTWEGTPRLIWDTMRYALKNVKKEVLLFAAASSWGPRPQILQCISDRISPDDFSAHTRRPISAESERMKTDRRAYYAKLASARFGLALPGLGYDCFRIWELLTMGSIVVIERGIGLDRTLWRLPVLLVDDFAEVDAALLRSAYVEAMYRAESGDFEFERLTQSFWFSVIFNVSVSKSVKPLLDAFPLNAEDVGFTRPLIPYDCGRTGKCGPGTKRIPFRSC